MRNIEEQLIGNLIEQLELSGLTWTVQVIIQSGDESTEIRELQIPPYILKKLIKGPMNPLGYDHEALSLVNPSMANEIHNITTITAVQTDLERRLRAEIASTIQEIESQTEPT